MIARHFRQRHIRLFSLISVLGLWLIGATPSVRADAPVTRGPGSAPAAVGGATTQAPWTGIEPLAPLEAVLGATGASPDQPTSTRGAAATRAGTIPAQQPAPTAWPGAEFGQWLERKINPGNWIVDSGLGIGTSFLQTTNEGLAVLIRGFTQQGSTPSAAVSVTPAATWNYENPAVPVPCVKIVLCTPADVFFGGNAVSSLLQQAWRPLQAVALSLVGVLFVLGIGRIATAGGSSIIASGGIDLFWSFIKATFLIMTPQYFLRILLETFASINRLLLRTATVTVPIPGVSDIPLTLAFGWVPSMCLTIMLIILLVMVFLSLVRLFKLFILFTIAPVMGAFMMDELTAGYYRAWSGKVLSLMFEQLAWVLAFFVGSAIANTMLAVSSFPSGNAGVVLGLGTNTLILVMALSAHKVIDELFERSGTPGARLFKRAVYREGLRSSKHLVKQTAGVLLGTTGGAAAGAAAGNVRASGAGPARSTPYAGSAQRQPSPFTGATRRLRGHAHHAPAGGSGSPRRQTHPQQTVRAASPPALPAPAVSVQVPTRQRQPAAAQAATAGDHVTPAIHTAQTQRWTPPSVRAYATVRLTQPLSGDQGNGSASSSPRGQQERFIVDPLAAGPQKARLLYPSDAAKQQYQTDYRALRRQAIRERNQAWTKRLHKRQALQPQGGQGAASPGRVAIKLQQPKTRHQSTFDSMRNERQLQREGHTTTNPLTRAGLLARRQQTPTRALRSRAGTLKRLHEQVSSGQPATPPREDA